MKLSRISRRPQLFGSVRTSSDRALVAFIAGLLVAVSLHAGAFVTRIAHPGAPVRTAPPAMIAAEQTSEPAVAARRPVTARRGAVATHAAVPCDVPRG